jgi:hypothetical protein
MDDASRIGNYIWPVGTTPWNHDTQFLLGAADER